MPLDEENKTRKNKTGTSRNVIMVRLVRESLALASVAGFVWMMCSVAHLVA
jgi:hypothetical protein